MSMELSMKDRILMMLEPIKKNDYHRRYDDSQVFAMALIYIIENLPTKEVNE